MTIEARKPFLAAAAIALLVVLAYLVSGISLVPALVASVAATGLAFILVRVGSAS